nr:hypothetical protein L203_01878 [Cryptococcus depauperatus CBS 7841]
MVNGAWHGMTLEGGLYTWDVSVGGCWVHDAKGAGSTLGATTKRCGCVRELGERSEKGSVAYGLGNGPEATSSRVWRCIGTFPVDGCVGSTAEWLAWRSVKMGGVH